MAGYRAVLANPLAMTPYSGLKHQDDKYDAGWMAELLRLGILPQAHRYGRKWRVVRDLLRQRSRWVREQTRVLSRCLGLVFLRSSPQSGIEPQSS